MDITLRIALGCAASLLACVPAYGDVRVFSQETWGAPTSVQISGTIARSDVAKVAAALIGDASKSKLACEIMVDLDSDGGDIEAAMDIGRLIHKRRAVFPFLGCVVPNARVPASSSWLLAQAGPHLPPLVSIAPMQRAETQVHMETLLHGTGLPRLG